MSYKPGIMRKLSKYLMILAFLVMPLFGNQALAGGVPPPPPDPGSEGDQDPPGGGASIGGGLLVLLSLSAGYGLKKVYDARRKLDE
jgi:hypothetical protein